MLTRINWKPQRRDLRYFAATLAIVAALLSLVVLATSTLEATAYVMGGGLLIAAACYFISPVGRIIYLLWMAVTFFLNLIVSPLVLGIIYYLVLTPIGLFYRLRGRDELRLKKPRDRESYFNEIEEKITPEEFERQF